MSDKKTIKKYNPNDMVVFKFGAGSKYYKSGTEKKLPYHQAELFEKIKAGKIVK